MSMVKNYVLTFIGLIFSLLMFTTSVIFEFYLFAMFVSLLSIVQQSNIETIIMPLLIFLIFVFVDIYRRNTKSLLEQSKVGIYKAMLQSSHHIINNLMYQMSIFKITAEDRLDHDEEIISYYDQIIDRTSSKIDSLSSIEEIDETSIKTAVLEH